MTFTCAQAFDVNFRTWQQNKDAAIMKATASESGDVGTWPTSTADMSSARSVSRDELHCCFKTEPAKAVQSPEVRRRVMAEEDAMRARSSSLSRSEAVRAGGPVSMSLNRTHRYLYCTPHRS